MKILILLLSFSYSSFTILAQESINIVSLDSQPIIKGKLNEKTAYFLVDSGSDVTIINLKDTKKFKINYGKMYSDRYRFSGLYSEHKGDILVAKGMDLELNDKKISGRYLLFDLSKIAQSLSKDSGIQINGIIGSDVMKNYNFVINYETEEIHFKAR